MKKRFSKLLADERGSVTAEFAIVLPAVLLVLVLVLGSVLAAAQRVNLTSAAAEIARLEARGDTSFAAARLQELGGAVSIARSNTAELLCVTLSAAPGSGLLATLRVEARGCAAKTTVSETGAE